MIDLIKQTFFTGIGLVAMTRDKVQEMATEIAKSAQLSGEKGKEFVQEAIDRSDKARKDFEEMMQKYVKEAVKASHVATHEDILKLNQRIAHLEQLLADKKE